MTNFHEVIAALIDGERVDPDGLKEALARPEGREYLVDLLALRELTSEQSWPTMGAVSGRMTGRRVRWLATAAAVVMASALGGYVAGHHTGLAPVSDVQRAIEASATPALVTLTPPAPTRVIRLDPGVDWQEGGGGIVK